MAAPDPEVIYRGLIDRGITPHVAEGIVANLQDESGLDPGINERNPIVPGSRGGFGLAQWTGPRRQALEQYSQSRGTPVEDVDTQLDFLVDELHGPESEAFRKLERTRTPNEAAVVFAKDFLRPSSANLERRVGAYSGGNLGGNQLRTSLPGQPDYAGMVNALAASLDDDPMQPPEPPFMRRERRPMFMLSPIGKQYGL